MTPKKYTIPAHVKGDTFMNGLGLVFVVTEGVAHTALDLTGYSIKCQFRFGSKTGIVQASLSESSGIVIYDTNKFSLLADNYIIDWAVGTYYYDIEFTDTDGVINTYLEGTLLITQDVTTPNG